MNGGVPQAANLTAHIEALRQDIVNTIPDPGFSGLAILDWEAWRPLTSENDDGLSCYTEYSKRLVRAEGGPHAANATWVAEEATARFDAGAQAIFTATVREVKKLRPLARVGFYSQGACPKTARPTPPPRIPPVAHSSSTLCCAVLYGLTWDAGSLPLTAPYPYTMLQCGCVGIDSSPANDDRLLWLWEEVDVLCPSIYPRTKPFNASAEAQSVNATVAEAVRAAELVRTLRTARGDARPPPAVMPSVLSPYSPTFFRILFEFDCAHFSGIQHHPFLFTMTVSC